MIGYRCIFGGARTTTLYDANGSRVGSFTRTGR